MHILRIAQEAITSSLKHSQATEIELKIGIVTEQEKRYAFVEINDNGMGIGNGNSGGKGGRNMYFRAKKIDARVGMCSDNNGTSVRLLIPAHK